MATRFVTLLVKAGRVLIAGNAKQVAAEKKAKGSEGTSLVRLDAADVNTIKRVAVDLGVDFPRRFARVTWNWSDIRDKRPNWSRGKCMEFLADNERHIQDAMVEAGWDAIDQLLPSDDDE